MSASKHCIFGTVSCICKLSVSYSDTLNNHYSIIKGYHVHLMYHLPLKYHIYVMRLVWLADATCVCVGHRIINRFPKQLNILALNISE